MTGSLQSLNISLGEFRPVPSKIFILVDENTRFHCLPELLSRSTFLTHAAILEIPSGEEHKSIETAVHLWKDLMQNCAGRHSLLVNLGGGVISDLGGFVASTYHRGIPYVNIPTTLMAQVDAAIGGKTGLNIGGVKNQAGTLCLPKAVFICNGFLKTLEKTDIANGFAEIIKYALIGDPVMWDKIKRLPLNDLLFKMPSGDAVLTELTERSIKIKHDIVEQDFREKNVRKVLNFGHTFGHALETLSMRDGNTPLSHGQAVAMGMLFEGRLSFKLTGLF